METVNLPEKLTPQNINEVGFNYRHDFGLDRIKEDSLSSGLTQEEREKFILHVGYIYDAIKDMLLRNYKDEN